MLSISSGSSSGKEEDQEGREKEDATNEMVDSLLDALAESESFPSSGDDDYNFSSFENGGNSDLRRERTREERKVVSDECDGGDRRAERIEGTNGESHLGNLFDVILEEPRLKWLGRKRQRVRLEYETCESLEGEEERGKNSRSPRWYPERGS